MYLDSLLKPEANQMKQKKQSTKGTKNNPIAQTGSTHQQ